MKAPAFTPRPGRFRQVPPAIFTPIFGLLGLGLAWRRASGALSLPGGVAELLLGAGVALYLFAVFAYAVKVALRFGVIGEDLRTLPGRGGLTAASLSVFLLAVVALPYSQSLARGVLALGLVTHVILALLYIRALIVAPPEGRRVTPIWHLAFVGFILAPLSAVPLGYYTLATAILWMTMPIAVGIWALSAIFLVQKGMPPPLRPLMAIHAAPAALFATVAASLGMGQLAMAFALFLGILLMALAISGRWIMAAGFSPLWGAFTFPSAAAASAFLMQPGAPFRSVGAAVLIAATLIVLPVLVKVMKLWAGGQLGPKTNAAIA